jgi:hypothetical protein
MSIVTVSDGPDGRTSESYLLEHGRQEGCGYLQVDGE